jgi:hypothetical protein
MKNKPQQGVIPGMYISRQAFSLRSTHYVKGFMMKRWEMMWLVFCMVEDDESRARQRDVSYLKPKSLHAMPTGTDVSALSLTGTRYKLQMVRWRFALPALPHGQTAPHLVGIRRDTGTHVEMTCRKRHGARQCPAAARHACEHVELSCWFPGDGANCR